jgi:hypothetical protein
VNLSLFACSSSSPSSPLNILRSAVASSGVSGVSFGEAGGVGWLGVSDLVSHFALLLHFWRNYNPVFTLFSRRREGEGRCWNTEDGDFSAVLLKGHAEARIKQEFARLVMPQTEVDNGLQESGLRIVEHRSIPVVAL